MEKDTIVRHTLELKERVISAMNDQEELIKNPTPELVLSLMNLNGLINNYYNNLRLILEDHLKGYEEKEAV